MSDALADSVKTGASIKGDLRTYRFCDSVWTFFLSSATLELSVGGKGASRESVQLPSCKIVAVAAPAPS